MGGEEDGQTMKIVIDIGAARYGGDYSIERLVNEFQPDMLYAFDPNPALTEKPPGECDAYLSGDTAVFAERMAAWTYRGTIGYLEDGLNSCLSHHSAIQVECFDLADFIRRRPEGSEIILKIDAEGAEYELLDHLIETDADKLLSVAWIEWHPFGVKNPEMRRQWIEENIADNVDLKEWHW